MTGLYAERGGQGARLIVLLHGLGATGAVWQGMAAGIEARGHRWIAPDFRGHGHSPAEGPFGFGVHTADLARLLAEEDPSRTTLLGHSFGGVVGALLAGGLFGPVPSRLVTLGVKQVWSAEEVAGAQAMAARPGKVFATEAEAWERYGKVSGLQGLVAPGALARGVRAVEGGFALAMAPGVFGAVGPSIEAILRGVQVPLRMAAGSGDPMVTLAQMRGIDPGALLLDGLPHNAHVAAPERVLALLD
ncbi:alpha/beta fold hydrolase [Pararhodobacter aggregans]|uniref:alpha/beta fold hydrolase n=1 Tax=Pararhodobacter aggregans TaxID=404875 RepID=UPI003A8F81FB